MSAPIDSYAEAVARLAVFHERTRRFLRTEDITPVVRGGSSSKTAREGAEKLLDAAFGFELVPVLADDQVKGYIVRSSIPEAIHNKLQTHWVDRGASSSALGGSNNVTQADSYRSNERLESRVREMERAHGSSGPWPMSATQGDTAYLAVTGLVLAIILVNNRTAQPAFLEEQIAAMGIVFDTASSKHTLGFDSFHSFMHSLASQRYVVATKAGDEPVWVWGPRANIEFGEQGIANFIASVHMARNGGSYDEHYGNVEAAAGRRLHLRSEKSDILEEKARAAPQSKRRKGR